MENDSQFSVKREGNIALYSQLVDIISDQIETGTIKTWSSHLIRKRVKERDIRNK